MQLSAHVETIDAEFGGRPLSLALVHGRRWALIDTGLVGTPAAAIFPYLHTRGLSPQDISLVVISHAHADHFGGNEELRAASGGAARFAAQRNDQAWIENPPVETQRAYGHFVELGLMTAADLDGGIRSSGHGVKLDTVLAGGEVFDLGDGVELEAIFAPGHSGGNLCLLERKSKVLIQGETAAGVAQFNAKEELLTVPFYEDLAVYLQTLAAVARLDFAILHSSHLPVMDRAAAKAHVAASLDFALRMEAEVVDRLGKAGHPLSAFELWQKFDGLWGTYPRDLGLFMLVESHLAGLIKRGKAGGSLRSGVAWLGGDNDLTGAVATARQAIDLM